MRLTIPDRKLTNPRRFVLEFAVDGFNAYEQQDDGTFELMAASPKAVGTDQTVWRNNCRDALQKTAGLIEAAIRAGFESQ